jgi:uncharacterized lipoprotein YmbA
MQPAKQPVLRLSAALMVASMTLAGGCATSQPSRFYLLSPLPEVKSAPAETAGTPPGVVLGVGPIRLPQYLDRPEIVTRQSDNTLKLGEFDRWAEPLTDNFSRVMAENLSALLDTDRVALYPWPRSAAVDYQVTLDVLQLDAQPSGEVVLRAFWSILRGEGEQLLLTTQSNFVEPARNGSYEDLVAAQSRVIGQLSQKIAGTLRELMRRASAR